MPNLTDVHLPYAFDYKNDVTIRGSTHFIPLSQLVIGDFYRFFNIQTPEMYDYCMDLLRGSDEITDLVISGGACPFENVTLFDLSVYPRLTTLTGINNGFMYVEEVKMIGLSELESVEIGMNSFTKQKEAYKVTPDPNRHFYLKDCPKLKSLKMGSYSFSDYTVIEIENVDALEVIEMCELYAGSDNFYSASLQLSSENVCVE